MRKLATAGIWHFLFKNELGEWTSRSTGHRDKPGAIRWAEAFSMRLTSTEFGLRPSEKRKGDDLIGPAFDEWLDYQKAQNTLYTWRSYRSIVKKFRQFLATKPTIKRLRHLTADVAMDFRRWAVGRSGSKVTVDNNLVALRSAFNYFKSKGKISVNPFSQQRHGERLFFKESSPRKDTYTDAEYSKIITAAEPADQPIFSLLGNLGLRASELAMLEYTDIDARSNTVSIRRKVTRDGIKYAPKDKTDRSIPMNEAVRKALQTIGAGVGDRAYVVSLPHVKSRRDYFERIYLKRLKGLSGATGIPEKKLTLHNFRRFFVSQCADCGIPMATVMNWLGHDEMKMVMYYYRLRDESAQQAMNKFRIGSSDHEADTERVGPNTEEQESDGRLSGGAEPPEVDGDRVPRCGIVRRNRIPSHAREHMGNDCRKTAFSARNRGKPERAGFFWPIAAHTAAQSIGSVSASATCGSDSASVPIRADALRFVTLRLGQYWDSGKDCHLRQLRSLAA